MIHPTYFEDSSMYLKNSLMSLMNQHVSEVIKDIPLISIDVFHHLKFIYINNLTTIFKYLFIENKIIFT